MSNIEASEDNIESPTTYGKEAYKKYKRARKENSLKTQPQNELVET
jgi:hypothetical protein